MTCLFDTDVLISYFNRKEQTVTLVEDLVQKAQTVAISILTITEIRTGWTDKQAAVYLPKLYDVFALEPVTQAIAEQAGMWRHTYNLQGKPLSTPDTIIAATAYLGDFMLVTNNTKDYPMPELRRYAGETIG